MNFVWSISEAQQARGSVGRSQSEVVTGSPAAMRLYRPVDDLAGHVGHRHLDHRNLGPCHLVSDRVHGMGSIERQQAGLLDHDPRFRDPLLRDRLFGYALAEGEAARCATAIRSSVRSESPISRMQ